MLEFKTNSMNRNSSKPIHILYAEDDDDDRMLFTDALKEAEVNASLTIVENGEKLLKFIKVNRRWADIIFLDLNMPRINGIECLKQLRGDSGFNHTPVIILSTSSLEKENLLENGASDFISKNDFSLNPVEMLTTILKRKLEFAL